LKQIDERISQARRLTGITTFDLHYSSPTILSLPTAIARLFNAP